MKEMKYHMASSCAEMR